MVGIKVSDNPEVVVESFLRDWGILPKETFIPVYETRTTFICILKIRDAGYVALFDPVKFIPGITFTDVLGTRDYFLGEIITVDKKLWRVVKAMKAIVLYPKLSSSQKTTQITTLRDDGFVKTYQSSEGSFIITSV